MTDLNEIISEYMAKWGYKSKYLLTPHQWMIIATEFAKEASKEQRVICSESAEMNFHDGFHKEDKPMKYFQSGADNLTIDKESILNAKSPV